MYLLVKRGKDVGVKFRLTSFPVQIGSAKKSTIKINDIAVSEIHLQIKKRGRLVILEDLESRSGTYLNGEKVVNSILKNGDSILIGDTELVLVNPNSSVKITSELLSFNMVVDQEHGIEGPISLSQPFEENLITPLKIMNATIINKLAESVDNVRAIYDIEGNILVVNSLEEASKSLLKGISTLSNHISRSAAFVWSSQQNKLVPVATKQDALETRSFRINKRALAEVLDLKQGVVIKDDSKGIEKRNTHRVILPMIHLNEVVCLIHMESDSNISDFPLSHLESIQTLLSRCAPTFQTMLQRQEIDSFVLGMVETVIATIEAKDTYTVGHSERVCRFSMAIADELKLHKDVKKMLMVSSLCHDIGKVGIPDAILKKASILSVEEYSEMKLHPTIGANIINNFPNAKKFLSGIKYHHEKWDGTGYPEGLSGENIPFFGRIIAVADVFDAMVSGRSYSGFIDESDAIEKIQKEADLFDPQIVKALVKAWENGRITQRTSTLSDEIGFGNPKNRQ